MDHSKCRVFISQLTAIADCPAVAVLVYNPAVWEYGINKPTNRNFGVG